MTITGLQIREARKLLGWGRLRFSRHTLLTEPTLVAIESIDGVAWLTREQESGIRSTLEAAGVILIENNDEGPSVRLRKPNVC